MGFDHVTNPYIYPDIHLKTIPYFLSKDKNQILLYNSSIKYVVHYVRNTIAVNPVATLSCKDGKICLVGGMP